MKNQPVDPNFVDNAIGFLANKWRYHHAPCKKKRAKYERSYAEAAERSLRISKINKYLVRKLQLDGIDVKFSTDEDSLTRIVTPDGRSFLENDERFEEYAQDLILGHSRSIGDHNDASGA